ncbi:MAG TPA: hypothetical protein VF457_12170, partial [Burkholderiaceae bacterium]
MQPSLFAGDRSAPRHRHPSSECRIPAEGASVGNLDAGDDLMIDWTGAATPLPADPGRHVHARQASGAPGDACPTPYGEVGLTASRPRGAGASQSPTMTSCRRAARAPCRGHRVASCTKVAREAGKMAIFSIRRSSNRPAAREEARSETQGAAPQPAPDRLGPLGALK